MAIHLLATTNPLAVLTFRVLSAHWHGPKLSDDYGMYNLCTLIVGDVAETSANPNESTDTATESPTPHTPQALTVTTTTSPLINALTEATVASVINNVEEDASETVSTRITRSRVNRLNLSATFDGFAPAVNPNAWRDRDLT